MSGTAKELEPVVVGEPGAPDAPVEAEPAVADTDSGRSDASADASPASQPTVPIASAAPSVTAAAKQPTTEKPPIDPRALVERLALRSKLLVDDIYQIAIRRMEAEERRSTRLDGKAQGLLVAAGLSLTVAFTFGGIIAQRPEFLAQLGSIAAKAVAGLYGAALVLGLLASIQAVRALRITDEYRGIDEHEVLNTTELAEADQDQDEERGRSRYRRFMTAHLWQIARQHGAVEESKARTILLGQRLFLAFLVVLLPIGAALALSAFGVFDAKAKP